MSAVNGDLMKLYSERILALAASIPHVGRLDSPAATASKRSRLCGSTVTVDVQLDHGRITGFAQDVKACALGQSSAAVLGSHVIGLTRDQVARGRDQLEAMIKRDGPAPDAPFNDLEALMPARGYKNRHASILLAWDATLEAIDSA